VVLRGGGHPRSSRVVLRCLSRTGADLSAAPRHRSQQKVDYEETEPRIRKHTYARDMKKVITSGQIYLIN
jgi:hypothetical protein